jgi:hypothetical protein
MKNMLFRGLFAACFAMTAYAGVYAQDEPVVETIDDQG